MTVATKMPIAQAVSYYLNVPFVIVRRDSKTLKARPWVSIMSLVLQSASKNGIIKRSLKRGSRVLVVDDFMKGGGTVNGWRAWLKNLKPN